MTLLGKGFGYVLLGLIQTIGALWLTAVGKDISGLAPVLLAINTAVYGGGIGKVWLESRKPAK